MSLNAICQSSDKNIGKVSDDSKKEKPVFSSTAEFQEQYAESVKRKTKKASEKAVKQDAIRKNPKRKVPKVNYKEPEVAPDDHYIYCDVCKQEYLGSCKKCGALVALKSVSVLMGVENRARKTLPEALEIRPSPIHGLGVFTKKPLKRGVRMGPYEGDIVRVAATSKESNGNYAWKLRNGRLVDGADERKSNYLRYINCSRHHTEQNVVAFQYKGDLYYRTCRDIEVGEELLVYYGDSFAKRLGIDSKKYHEPEMEMKLDEVFFCKYCNSGYTIVEYRDRHISRCSYNPVNVIDENAEYFTCQYCHFTLSSNTYLQRHEKYCGSRKKSYGTSTNRRDLNNIVNGNNKVVNKNDEMKNEDSKDVNTNGKSGEGTILKKIEVKCICDMCMKTYSSKRNLKMHIETIHNRDKARKYSCELCNFVTVYKTNLSTHKGTHDKLRMFVCPLCKHSFNRKRLLKYHMNNHVNIKQYKCKQCEYSTNIKSNLSQHINDKHTKHIYYSCSNCSYKCTQASAIRKHEKSVHSKIKPYKCLYCNYSCALNQNLKGHVDNIHLHLKPYKCDYCPYSAAYKAVLNIHINGVHTHSKIYTCQYCNFNSPYNSAVYQHKKNIHAQL